MRPSTLHPNLTFHFPSRSLLLVLLRSFHKMKSTLILPGLLALASASPVARRASGAIDDATILNYALTLEHLEDTFYREGLANYSLTDFTKAGFTETFYNNIKETSLDETTHVAFLTSALTAAGAKPVAACTYDFGVTDVTSFIKTASILEGVGVSAYLGAAADITHPGQRSSGVGTKAERCSIATLLMSSAMPTKPRIAEAERSRARRSRRGEASFNTSKAAFS